MSTPTTTSNTAGNASRAIAGEIRAEMARQGISRRKLAERMGVTSMWIQRRISPSCEVGLTIDEIEMMSDALGVPTRQILQPRLELVRREGIEPPTRWLSDSPEADELRAFGLDAAA